MHLNRPHMMNHLHIQHILCRTLIHLNSNDVPSLCNAMQTVCCVVCAHLLCGGIKRDREMTNDEKVGRQGVNNFTTMCIVMQRVAEQDQCSPKQFRATI